MKTKLFFMKTKLFAVLFVVLLPTLLFADYDPYKHAKIGDLYYHLDVDTKTAEVTDESNYYNRYNNYSSLPTTLDIPQTVTFYGASYTVTSIDNCAFNWCNRLTHISLPNTITSIGNRAFDNCTNLRSITISEGVTSIGDSAFSWCTSLKSITLPSTITTIENHVFDYCTDLYSITIPKGITSIGDYAFKGCSSLRYIALPNTVTNIGDYAFANCNNLSSITIPKGSTSIGDYAFANCNDLSFITIPESVTSIGDYAFKGCHNIKSVLYNAINCICSHAFDKCPITSFTFGDKVEYIPYLGSLDSLTSITIPESVIHIAENAFSECKNIESVVWNAINCFDEPSFNNISIVSFIFGDKVEYIPYLGSLYSLTSITIPKSVIHIQSDAFRGCSSLVAITWNAKNFIGNSDGHPFYSIRSSIKHFYFGDNVDTIPNVLCDNMTNLNSVSIPKNVKSIGINAFSDCNSLHSVNYKGTLEDWCNIDFLSLSSNPCYYADAFYINDQLEKNPVIPNTIKILKPYVFVGAWLESITLSENLTSIGAKAFRGCSRLNSITIPESVTSIGDETFKDCSGLRSVKLPTNLMEINAALFSGCSSLTSITIPENVTSIKTSAFEGCSSLTSITIPESVTSIGDAAFRGCSSLTSITIPENVTSIKTSAFEGCSSLTSITIPESVTSIGGAAFRGCSSLTSITIPESVTSIGYSVFEGCSRLRSITWNASNYKGAVTLFYDISKQIKEFTFGSSTIPACICRGMSNLVSITITKGVGSTGISAFEGCNSLHNIIWNATDCPNISSPKESPFYDIRKQIYTFSIGSECSAIPSYIGYGMSIKKITIPESIKSIGSGAFAYCDELTQVEYHAQDCSTSTPCSMPPFKNNNSFGFFDFSFGNAVSTIPAYLCAEICSLEEVTLPENLTSIGVYAFYNCDNLKEISFPNCITEIGQYAFAGCSSLQHTNLFNTNLTIIETGVFMDCRSLVILEFPKGVKNIKSYAFYNIRGGSPRFPESVTNIGNSAFANIGNMLSIHVNAFIPPQIDATTFKGVYCDFGFGQIVQKNEIPVYVPKDALADYQADPYWSEFKLLSREGSAVEDVTIIDGITLRGNVLSINGHTDESMYLYMVNGAQLYAGQVRDITLPNAGVYLVRIGNTVQKLIVP